MASAAATAAAIASWGLTGEDDHCGCDRRRQHQERLGGLEPAIPAGVPIRRRGVGPVTVDDVTERQAQMVSE